MSNLSELERLVLSLTPPSERDVLGRTIIVGRYFERIKLDLIPRVSVDALQATLDSLIKKGFLIRLNKNFYGRTGRPFPGGAE